MCCKTCWHYSLHRCYSQRVNDGFILDGAAITQQQLQTCEAKQGFTPLPPQPLKFPNVYISEDTDGNRQSLNQQ